MSWRVVVVSKRSKLEYKMNYLVIRDTEVVRIHLSEVHTLIVESTAVSLTAMLLTQLLERKINVVFCDNKRNPLCTVLPFYGSHDSTRKIKQQLTWHEDIKDLVWVRLVREKILNQACVLKTSNREMAHKLEGYAAEVVLKDATNREAHAAKVYFNALFGSSFTRKSESPINVALNYGYSIILSAINREVATSGYLTQLGIFHDNVFNQFNFSSDLIEPLRPMIDREVASWGSFTTFSSTEKMKLVDLLNQTVIVVNKRYHFAQALEIYCKSVFDALSERDISLMKSIEYG